MDMLFGKRPKLPTLVQQPKPPTQITQTDAEKARIMKDLAKRRRATFLSQGLGEAAIRTQKLGAR